MQKQMLGKLLFASEIGLSEEAPSLTTIYNSETYSAFRKKCMWTMRMIKTTRLPTESVRYSNLAQAKTLAASRVV